MATTTYEPIISYTIPSNTTSITLGAGGQGTIPSTYTDLVLVIGNFGMSNGGSAVRLRFNGDTSSAYSATWMGGFSTTPFTGIDSSQTSMRVLGAAQGPGTSNNDTATINILNYSNTNVNKTVLVHGALSTEVYRLSGLWRNTAAVTSITLISYNGTDTIRAGTTLSLYGIANAQIEAPKATGGIITYDDTYFYHTFGASGTFTPQQSLTADVLVVAGGGAGGFGNGGAGGGAGGYRTTLDTSPLSLSASAYTVTVGGGGPCNFQNIGQSGTNSSFAGSGITTITSTGGGAGASDYAASNGLSGGSGGGGMLSSTVTRAPGSGNAGGYTPVEGYAGGTNSYSSGAYVGAGGGGAGAAGGNVQGVSGGGGGTGGNGGAGRSTNSAWGLVTGTGQNVSGTVYYAGGGGGGGYPAGTYGQGTGGLGGGGTGGNPGNNGLANTGSGGGGAAGNPAAYGGNGGSGVVIIRYLKA